MRKYYIGKETLKVLEDSDIELKYFILETEKVINNKKIRDYGIEIEKQDNTRTEKSRVSSITTDQTRIDYIVKTLMKNGVTPIHLYDVIEDIL